MTRRLLALLICVVPSVLAAQLGELQVGAVGSYGTSDPYRKGGGFAFGIAPGRLVYVGLRWIYYQGSGTPIRNRAQVFATDLGIEIPVRNGRFEVRPGVGIGFVRFAHDSAHAEEFFSAPGIALQLTAGRIGIIPEFQYYFTGDRGLAWPLDNKGPAVSIRLVFLTEIRRIRR